MARNVVIYDRREKSGDLLLNCFHHKGFTATLVQDVNDLHKKPMDILVTEVNDEKLFDELKTTYPDLKILVFSDFSRDPFVENLYNSSIELALSKSYKINDIIDMTSQVSSRLNEEKIIGLNKYFQDGFETNHSLCGYFKNSYTGSDNSISDSILNDFEKFLQNAGLLSVLNDPEMIRIALNELIDNAIQAQSISSLNEYNVNLEIGCDQNKIGISVHNAGNAPNKESLFSSLNRKMKLKHDESSYFSSDPYEKNTYVGKSGRGFYIIQKGVHLLSIMLMEDQKNQNAPSFFEASILLFITRHNREKTIESRKKPGYYMVLTV